MKVFKFGGASVKDADSVRNVARIVKEYRNERLIAVISAMGKTTNALEQLVNAYFHRKPGLQALYESVKNYHYGILDDLFSEKDLPVFDAVSNCFVEIDWVIEEEPAGSYDFIYDQIVSLGEMLSSVIVSAYLNREGVFNTWMDVRDCIKTDNTYREARVDWNLTRNCTQSAADAIFKLGHPLIVTQGFIGVTSENYTTTLGREGSDYSAAILAYSLDADEVTIWKDVPGVLNADPKYFSSVQKLEKLSYSDAIELAYYGASVIHPKTIKPLQNKNIPLFVRSFIDISESGTKVSRDPQTEPLIPSYIFKVDQVLVSISAKDFSFIVEENLTDIFSLFSKLGIKINLMQNSAISFSVCTDHSEKVKHLIQQLKKKFKVLYNDRLELVTIRHYNQVTIDFVSEEKEVLLEQRSRHTAQLVMRSLK